MTNIMYKDGGSGGSYGPSGDRARALLREDLVVVHHAVFALAVAGGLLVRRARGLDGVDGLGVAGAERAAADLLLGREDADEEAPAAL